MDIKKQFLFINALILCGVIFVASHRWYYGPRFAYGEVESNRTHHITLLSQNMDRCLQYFAHYLPANAVVVEAGAYDGNDTARMAKFWNKGTVHTFEPVPYNFEHLQQAVRGSRNVHTYQQAIGDKDGTTTFYLSQDSNQNPTASGSVLKPAKHAQTSPSGTFGRTIEVPINTLDTWAQQHNVDHVDFLWLDMQGFELPMLQASQQILKTVKAIYTEIEFTDLYDHQPLYKDVKQWLEQQGFVLVARDFEIPTKDCSGNAFFVRKELVS